LMAGQCGRDARSSGFRGSLGPLPQAPHTSMFTSRLNLDVASTRGLEHGQTEP